MTLQSFARRFSRRNLLRTQRGHVTSQPDKIRQGILEILERGVTVLEAEGGYTGENRIVLMAVVRRRETNRLREIVRAEDPLAFVVISASHEVLGEGFKPLTRPSRRSGSDLTR